MNHSSQCWSEAFFSLT